MRDKVYFFIDWWYFYRWTKRLKVENLDIKKACEKIAWDREIVWICYYVWEIDTHMWKNKKSKEYFADLRIKQQKFLSKIKETWIDYKLWYFNKWWDQEKSVDMLLACDMIEKAMENTYNVWIVLTWDWDFHPAINLVKRKLNKIILNWAFKWYFSKILMDTCDRFFFIDNKF